MNCFFLTDFCMPIKKVFHRMYYKCTVFGLKSDKCANILPQFDNSLLSYKQVVKINVKNENRGI